MAAAVRGGGPRVAKPAARTSKTPARRAPSKLKASKAFGIDPSVAGALAGALFIAGAGAFLFTGDRLAGLGQGIARAMGGLGFEVQALHLQGASPAARADIIAAAGIEKDQPILAIDLAALRERVEKVGWVDEARVVRLLPDTLVIHVKERPPAAVWQYKGVVRVIDADGRVIPEAEPAKFPRLPFLVGQGANEAAARRSGEANTIIELVGARPRIAERLEALVRVDDRRWDLRLKDGGLVQLPAVGEDSALIQLDRLDQDQRILELGFERIDLRTPEMVVVRRRDVVPPGQILAGGA